MKSYVAKTEIDYWKEQLGGYLSPLQLPSDRAQRVLPHRARNSNLPYLEEKYNFTLKESLTEALENLSVREEINLSVILLAAFQVLLYRYTEREDILVGTRVNELSQNQTTNNGSNNPVNPVAIRINIDNTLNFREFVADVNQVILEAHQHQEFPLEQLLPELDLGIDITPQSLFQVMFIFQPAFAPTVDSVSEKYRPELSLSIVHRERSLSGTFKYDSNLCDRVTIERLAGHFQTLLVSITENPELGIGKLNLLTESELHQILVEWKGKQVDYPGQPCIVRLFEAQVNKTPDATAVVFEQQQLTYRELDRLSNQLARYLKKQGVGSEIRVGLCTYPCLEMVVGILGIFKAGGVYVPLDPTYPQERLTFLLEDSCTSVLLTQQQLVELLPSYSGKIVCLDANWEEIGQLESTSLETQIAPHHAAYVVYTSGTTGKPKGVVAEHSNLTNYLLATGDRFGFDSHDVMPCIARFSFSISLFELLTPLISGGTAMLFPRERILELERFVKDLERVTNLHTVPGLMWQILDFIEAKGLDNNRYDKLARIFIGGDIVPPDLLERIKKVFPAAQIYVLYGCSEATTLLLNYKVPKDSEVKKKLVGKPFNNMSVRLYDKEQNLVPAGIPGEIYAGGVGITRGYLNREELTREKYLVLDGQRFYRTGDLGRYLADGHIEFLGRSDYQVKIRGVRIELGEIEAALGQHPEVNKTVVMAWDGEYDNKLLVAYVVPHQGYNPTTQELRTFLQSKLPSYLLPSAFVILDAFPLNPNGKIDRKALPPPERVRHQSSVELVTPRDNLETQLIEIWSEILGVRPSSIKDDFYDLGGNSLLAVRLFAQIARVFGIDLPISLLLKSSTIEQLAEILRQDNYSTPWTCLVPIQTPGDRPPLFCIHAVGGGIFFYRDLAKHLDRDRPIYALQARGIEGGEPLTSIKEMATLYLQEIRTVQPEGPYFLAGYSFGAMVALEMAQQLLERGQQVGFLGLIEHQAPGYRKRVGSVKKMLRHLNNFLRLGPVYLQQKRAEKQRGEQGRLKQLKEIETLQTYLDRSDLLPYEMRIVNVKEACQKAYFAYELKAYPGKVTLFLAENEPKSPGWDYDPQRGWGNFVRGGVEVCTVIGTHDSIIREPHIGVLAKRLSYELNKAQAANLSTCAKLI